MYNVNKLIDINYSYNNYYFFILIIHTSIIDYYKTVELNIIIHINIDLLIDQIIL